MSFPGMKLQQCWHLVDAKSQTVGRVAQQVAMILRGKHKPTFLPNKDMGDHIVVINASQCHFSGTKWKNKLYRWHTGYPGGLKERSAQMMLQKNPTQILRKAIVGMLARTTLRTTYMESRLKIYPGSVHPHTAQLPIDKVQPLPPVPRSNNGSFHFGLWKSQYVDPASYQFGSTVKNQGKSTFKTA
jgi:large subunit ribosomal protein L13